MVSRNNKLLRILKTLVKVCSTWHFEGKKAPILLFATPRGGSTWVSEVICREPKMRYVAEPLNLRSYGVSEQMGLDDWRDMWDADVELFVRYFEKLTSGESRIRDVTPLRHLGRYGIRLFTSRTLLKVIHGGTGHARVLATRLRAISVVVLRHPIATAVSREVFPALECVMDSAYFRSLGEEKQNCIREVMESGDHLRKGVLAWCLHNGPLLEGDPDDLFYVTYEELVLCSGEAGRKLCDYCDLSETEAILGSLNYASVTTRKSDKQTQAILQERSGTHRGERMVKKWRDKVSAEQEDKAMEILSVFRISVYVAGSVLPDVRYCHDSGRMRDIAKEWEL